MKTIQQTYNLSYDLPRLVKTLAENFVYGDMTFEDAYQEAWFHTLHILKYYPNGCSENILRKNLKNRLIAIKYDWFCKNGKGR